MKRFLTIFPIIMVLIMSNMVYLCARAVDDEDFNIFIGYTWDDDFVSLDRANIGVENWKTNKSVTEEQYYFYFENMYLYSEGDISDLYILRSNFIYFDLANIESSEYDNETGVYTLTLTDTQRAYYCGSGMTVEKSTNVFLSSTTPVEAMSNYVSSIDTIKYYVDEKKIEYYNGTTLKSTRNNVKNVDSNCENIPTMGVDLSVSFTPSLSGEVDRTIEQNGVQAESDYFSMSITNNSSKNAQFLMAIVPSGATASFCGNSLSAVGVDFSLNAIYYLMYKEWVYSPAITGTVGSTGKALEKEYYQASAWHIVNGNSTYTRQFNWQQINIQSGTSYDVVVVAVPTDFTKPSNVFSNSDCAHYLDSSTGAEVYRSTFTVPNPATYDSTNTDFGNIIGVPAGSLTQADGYIDENGEAVIEDVSASDMLADRETWEPGILESDGNFSLADITANLTMPIDFFNFFMSFFYILPSWVIAALAFSLTALVAIGIIKALL